MTSSEAISYLAADYAGLNYKYSQELAINAALDLLQIKGITCSADGIGDVEQTDDKFIIKNQTILVSKGIENIPSTNFFIGDYVKITFVESEDASVEINISISQREVSKHLLTQNPFAEMVTTQGELPKFLQQIQLDSQMIIARMLKESQPDTQCNHSIDDVTIIPQIEVVDITCTPVSEGVTLPNDEMRESSSIKRLNPGERIAQYKASLGYEIFNTFYQLESAKHTA